MVTSGFDPILKPIIYQPMIHLTNQNIPQQNIKLAYCTGIDNIEGRILRFHWEIDQYSSNPEIAEKGQNLEPVEEYSGDCIWGYSGVFCRMWACQIKIQGGRNNFARETICCGVGIFFACHLFVILLS